MRPAAGSLLCAARKCPADLVRSGGANIVDHGLQHNLLAGLADSVLEIDGIVDFGYGSVGLEIPADPAAAIFIRTDPLASIAAVTFGCRWKRITARLGISPGAPVYSRWSAPRRLAPPVFRYSLRW